MSFAAPAPPPLSEVDPTIDFVGLFADQTEDVILGRMRDWANEGLDPVADAERWVDTREGGHWFMAAMPGVREIARLYDLAGTEVPMSGFILWAWGTYLDDLAAAYNIDRKAATQATGTENFTGPPGTPIAINTTVGTVPVGPDDPAPEFATTQAGVIPAGGVLSLPIQATDAGSAGDVAAHAITAPSTPLPAGVTVDNPQATGGGTDPETDEALRLRVLEAILGSGGANVAAYIRWASAWPGVGKAKVVPAPTGPNTVLVVVSDDNGQPLPGSVVSALQGDLDPTPGLGSGTAPVGAEVTVETSTVLNITVTAQVTYKQDYSSDGTGNTIALHDPISSAIQNYLLGVQPGGAVRNSHIAGLIATWEGVENVQNVQLNGQAVGTDVPVSLSPPQAPTLQTLTI